MIQATKKQSYSVSGMISLIAQFYRNRCKSQSNCWIGQNLPGFSKHILKYWVKISYQSELNKATQHRLEVVA
jgi:hypothetical protein